MEVQRPLLMGVINVTPDSFSDGGSFLDPEDAIAQGLRLAQEGAHVLDIGGESTRPGADPGSEDEELWRVKPVLEGLVDPGATPSIDTMKPGRAEAAPRPGAGPRDEVTP